MPNIKWQALSTCEFGVFHVSLRMLERPCNFSVDHSRRGRGSSGILLLNGGKLTFLQDGLPALTMEGNSLCLLPQSCRYRLHFLGEHNRLMLLNFILLTPQGEPILPGDRIEILSHNITEPKLLRFMDDYSQAFASEPAGNTFRQKEYLYRLLSLLFEEDAPWEVPQTKYANLAPGIRLLRQTFLEDLPIDRFSQACCISSSSFRSLFTQLYGISPLRYRNQLRLNYARQLLKDGHCTVREAAERSGFNNLGYFCRLYKKSTGETPGQTRSRYSG